MAGRVVRKNRKLYNYNSGAQMPNCEKSWSPLVWNSHNYLPILAIFMDSWIFPISTSVFAFQVALTCNKDLVQLSQSRIAQTRSQTKLSMYMHILLSWATNIYRNFGYFYHIIHISKFWKPSHDISWAVIFIFSTNFVVFSKKNWATFGGMFFF